MMEMEVSPDDSQSSFQGRISPAAPEQHQQPQSPDAICSTLQSIESEISSYQEELASYQICASLKSMQQTPGLMDSYQSAMELVEQKISTHVHKRAPDRDNDGFQLPPKRNAVKPPMFTFPNSVPTTNKFAQLESLPIPDPPTPQAPRFYPHNGLTI
ncbi:hypothetical protein CDAR_508971 [Caerostris darwini]|uniref:Uncharacterized protein n=1 Tax=Caerostris darwini TaxID=1538125 RepID=A0AAV4N479_9ARAC|nr:hypothetical protein CDAR_508971 [Caerostris darwini]